MPNVSTREFLSTVWGDSRGVAELATLGRDGKLIAFPYPYPDELDAFVAEAGRLNGQTNLFFGVCLRASKWDKGRRGTANQALSANCLWVDIDFSKTPREEAIKRLREFPIKASIGVLSGGGIHAYWLLKEPITGDELRQIPSYNRALAASLGGDKAHDLARILRLPGTKNLKYSPPRDCEICVWRPELRYTLHSFEKILYVDVGGGGGGGGNSGASSSIGERVTEFRNLPEEAIDKVVEILRSIWTPGIRHSIALHVAGALAHAGVGPECAKEIISQAAGGDEEIRSRLADVDTTYARYGRGENVAGIPELLQIVDTQFPEVAREKAARAVKMIASIIRPPRRPGRPPKKEVEADFEVVRIVKFDSRPARYEVTVRKDGVDHVVTCETDTLISIRSFRVAFFEATKNLVIAPIAQTTWEGILSSAPLEIRQAPMEATVRGAIEAAFEEFLSESKENPDYGELRTYPGHDDHERFFRLEALKGHLRHYGIPATNQELIHVLRDLGWTPNVRRVGEKTARVWLKEYRHNGSAPVVEGDQSGGQPKNPLHI